MDGSFWNSFALKVILLNILQSVLIFLFTYFLSHITLVPDSDTFLYYRQIKFP